MIGSNAGRDLGAHDAGGGSRRVAAVVVFFRTPECLGACLDALRAQTMAPEEIVVVDNSSALDGHLERPSAGEDYRWVRAASNLGFAAACNLGARVSQSDYLLFLNADVVLGTEACARLWGAADSLSRVDVVGPRIRASDGTIELSARAFPRIVTGILGRSSMLTRILKVFSITPPGVSLALGESRRVDWVSGACMFVRRSAFQEIGGFDEGYWMYWEDADICRRLRDRGSGVMLCVEAQAEHHTGSSGRDERTIEAFHLSAARYYEQHLAMTQLGARFARLILVTRMRVLLGRHGRS